MKKDEIVTALRDYVHQIANIESGFTSTRDGIYIRSGDDARLHTLVLELIDMLGDHVPQSSAHAQMLANAFNLSSRNMEGRPSLAGVRDIGAVAKAVLTRVERMAQPETGTITLAPTEATSLDMIDCIMRGFHAVALQLRKRHADRPTLDINDEYDVQDLFHALLRQHFDDVREEEWTPSYAGASSRTDFLIPSIDTFIEIKKTRPNLTARALGEQLIVDIFKYKAHPQCRRLVCFVYDPEGRIHNPAAIENDLGKPVDGLEVQVHIFPKEGRIASFGL